MKGGILQFLDFEDNVFFDSGLWKQQVLQFLDFRDNRFFDYGLKDDRFFSSWTLKTMGPSVFQLYRIILFVFFVSIILFFISFY
ncbi:unnamed protein product [Rhizophagus irregularis]|uniref:Uncharacterized protein n=1 Tax=Rhizophagus irregularis TaxID=588596 RepID=A0A916E4K2_9GLOM|nr:unnamed protein product [Rhizophagus irregularis]CAB5188919.1 unnamed protein product [Rhizophagus irregularis]CAB5358735.1 unnamed protein product [Rhizophagus irregularis]